MDEGDEHVLLHLLDAEILSQVGPDPPVLLLENGVVDPAAVGRLQQRVVEEEEEPPAQLEDPGHLSDGVVDVGDVFEDEASDDGVERGCSERERRRA